MWRICLTIVAVATCCVGSAIAEKAYVEIGALTCTLGGPGEALATSASFAGQKRDALCTFRPRSGADETYAAKIQGVGISADQKKTLIWVVQNVFAKIGGAGMLEQSYAADPQKALEQEQPMIGEVNPDIVLHSMTDEREGSASAPEKARPRGFLIRSLELTLKSTSTRVRN